MPPRPFQIAIPDSALADLRARLANTRWPDEVNDENWSYGSRLGFVQNLCEYWRDGFDWRAVEARLNRLPQFVVDIDGIPIHFVHARGKGPKPLPLVVTHGWPGSFIEMEAILPLLTDPGAHGGDPADAFDVVVPSLPGFGFSGRATRMGCNPRVIGAMWAKLMGELGYARFGVQGGDWGAHVSTQLAFTRPDLVIAAHLNFSMLVIAPDPAAPFTAEEQDYIAARQRWRDAEGGYSSIQSTKPQTLAYGLTDSPAALAAWISEKFRSWTDCGGRIENAVSLDTLLANISIYWLTGNIASSLRIYKENLALRPIFAPGERIQPPLGYAKFPKEIIHPPRAYAERVFDVAQWTEMPRGGHFAALEQPELLAADIRKFFRRFRAGTG